MSRTGDRSGRWSSSVASSDSSDTLAYMDLVAWMENWLLPTVRRYMRSTSKWCERWWAHPEAAARLGALWAAWEVANVEGGAAMAQWWASFDSHWEALTESHGPFGGCGEGRCRHAARLPSAPCPPDVLSLIRADR